MIIYVTNNIGWEIFNSFPMKNRLCNKYGWSERKERILDYHSYFPYLSKYSSMYEIELNDDVTIVKYVK